MKLTMMFFHRGSSVRRLLARGICAGSAALAMLAAGDAGAQSAVKGVPNAMQGFSQNRDQPIQIEAASLEMRDKKKEATFSGNVKVVQGDTTMTSKALVVFYEQSAPLRPRLHRQPMPKARRRPRSSRQRPVPAAVRRSAGWRPGAASSSPRRIRS